VTVPTTALVLCDYCFPDESEEVCIVLAADWDCKKEHLIGEVQCVMCAAGLQGKSE